MHSVKALVINASPLLALFAALDDLAVLKPLFARVIAPFEVAEELRKGGRFGFGVERFEAESWLEKRETATTLSPFMVEMLDPGEAAVISLALAEGIANVCIDDLKGRRIARLAGLRLVGSLGLLLAAKQAGATIRLRDAVDRMRQRNIWLSESLVRNVLTQAGE